MRSHAFVIPKLAKSEWESYAIAYKPLEAEQGLMAQSEGAARRGHLEFEEFLAIARWKSPRPTSRYLTNSKELVREVTSTSFVLGNDIEKVVEMTRLAGINVRSATAILHLCFPQHYPLLDFRAMAALGISGDVSKKWYELQWLRMWKPYISVCRDLSAKLDLTLRNLDRALWAKGRADADSTN